MTKHCANSIEVQFPMPSGGIGIISCGLVKWILGLTATNFQNYNKSRIHSFRGVRDVTMALDGKVIFRGEIARASGGIFGGTEAFGDVSSSGSRNFFNLIFSLSKSKAAELKV